MRGYVTSGTDPLPICDKSDKRSALFSPPELSLAGTGNLEAMKIKEILFGTLDCSWAVVGSMNSHSQNPKFQNGPSILSSLSSDQGFSLLVAWPMPWQILFFSQGKGRELWLCVVVIVIVARREGVESLITFLLKLKYLQGRYFQIFDSLCWAKNTAPSHNLEDLYKTSEFSNSGKKTKRHFLLLDRSNPSYTKR